MVFVLVAVRAILFFLTVCLMLGLYYALARKGKVEPARWIKASLFIPCILLLGGHFCPMGGVPEEHKCRRCPLPNAVSFIILTVLTVIDVWKAKPKNELSEQRAK
jgi:hypothetical protein